MIQNLDTDLVIEEERNGWRIIRLNRPNALNALDKTLVLALTEIFKKFEQDPQVKAIWLDSTSPKAFCAGGDVRQLRHHILNNQKDEAVDFFRAEYALNLMLHQYTKPIIVWGEGYVMGGGLGLFMAAPFRLVTKYSRLAMPEINIGLYPDMGGTRFLADRGTVGLFTGLTGSIMTSAGAYAIGWATHVCEMDRQTVLSKVLTIDWENYSSRAFRAIEDVLATIHRPMPAGPLQNSLETLSEVCQGQVFEEDYISILTLSDARSDWLRQASDTLRKGSPVTAAITWLLWQWAKTSRTWQEVFELEMQISTWKLQQPDFIEGVRARLIDKDFLPIWKKPNRFTLQDILADSPPINHIPSWNTVLKHYHVI